MKGRERFDRYLDHLSASLGHADRVAGLKGYCTGLMLPLERKSVEPMAAGIDPRHASARHQSLHHFVAKAEWSEESLLQAVAHWVLPKMNLDEATWIIDDTGIPKKGAHSVGVTRQYCGQLGKQDNCQVAVSISLATEHASLPMAYQLYLPKVWAEDKARRRKAGVPNGIGFATKTEIALAQLERLLERGHPKCCVLADAGYGVDTSFRQRLSDLGLPYMVGITSAIVVWSPGILPLPPTRRSIGPGRPPLMPRRTPHRQPVDVKQLAMSLPASAYQRISWREGTNAALSGRFAAVRVRHAGGNAGRARLRPEQWLLIEWPAGDAEPLKYYLSTLPADTPLNDLVAMAHRRWRIERDYQDLKQEFGLDHYEGRGWRGFHHHAALTIASYGFLVSERLDTTGPGKKNFLIRSISALPTDYIPRGSPARAASRRQLGGHTTSRTVRKTTPADASVPVLRKISRKPKLVTQ